MDISKVKETVCSCEVCVSFCKTAPCLGLPGELQKIIDAGHGDKLMLDYRSNRKTGKDIYILSPATESYELGLAPFGGSGICIFLTDDSKCSLHSKGLKPLEGRVVDHDLDFPAGRNLRMQIVKNWENSELGKRLIKKWKEKYL